MWSNNNCYLVQYGFIHIFGLKKRAVWRKILHTYVYVWCLQYISSHSCVIIMCGRQTHELLIIYARIPSKGKPSFPRRKKETSLEAVLQQIRQSAELEQLLTVSASHTGCFPFTWSDITGASLVPWTKSRRLCPYWSLTPSVANKGRADS